VNTLFFWAGSTDSGYTIHTQVFNHATKLANEYRCRTANKPNNVEIPTETSLEVFTERSRILAKFTDALGKPLLVGELNTTENGIIQSGEVAYVDSWKVEFSYVFENYMHELTRLETISLSQKEKRHNYICSFWGLRKFS
jgi:hypothetical protein